MYPYIYGMSSMFVLFNVWILPWISLAYIIDPYLFLEESEEKPSLFKKSTPREGFPSLLAELNSIFGLLYFNFEYLYTDEPLLSFATFIYL